MGYPVSFTIDDGVLVVRLAEFNARFATALGPLLAYLRSTEFRTHRKWRQLMPFDVPTYGDAPSLGHCVRPDIILTERGPRVCELDFVPSGRGVVLDGLARATDQEEFLRPFHDWYRAMNASRVAYATATTTVCYPETVRFAELMRDMTGLSIDAVNIDRGRVHPRTLVDRLFYRSEVARRENLVGQTIMTAEPWLDSKMVFAVIHDPDMSSDLTEALGAVNLAFLREVMLETYPLQVLRADRPGFLASDVLGIQQVSKGQERARRRGWVLKNSDVETDASWGSRGVVIGSSYTEAIFAAAVLRDVSPTRKVLGRQPVLQRFAQSADLRTVWNAVVDGSVWSPSAGAHGWGMDPSAQQPARRHVYGRLGCYLLVANTTGQVFTPTFGVCTVRQDVLAHGAKDARIVTVRVA